MKRVAIVLAAGMARRMSGPNKLLLPFRGKPLVRWAAEAACGSIAERVVLVTGRDGDAVAEAAGEHARLTRTHNEAPERGLATSLHLGLAAAAGAECIAVLLADMPLVDAALIDDLFARWRAGAYAIVPVHQGAMGNPVILGVEAAADCMKLEGDAGARKLLEAHSADVMRAPVATTAIFADVDSAPDLAALS